MAVWRVIAPTLSTTSIKRRAKRKWVWLVILLGLSAAGYGYYLQTQKEKPIEIQVSKVSRRNLTEVVIANGRIQPVTQVKISPEVSGEIIELPVKEGQAVQKGDLLARIKPDLYAASRRSAEASYKSALAAKAQSAASLEKTELEFKRNAALFHDKLVSETVYQEFRTARNVAAAGFESASHQVDVAKAALARAEEDLAKTSLYSPITGTVSKLNSQLGERVVGTAMMTGTEMMVVADLTVMEARVEVGEMDVVLMQPGLKALLEVDAFTDRKFNGKITEVANSSRNSLSAVGGGAGGGTQQEATRFEVRIRIEEKDPFRPGMSVTAEIETRYRTNVLTAPIQSVTTRLPNSQGAVSNHTQTASPPEPSPSNASGPERKRDANKPLEVVFVYQNNGVKSLPVKRGISDDTYVEILEGLTEGQEVVSGSYKAISRDLKDDSKVKLSDPAKPPPPATPASP